VRPFSPVRYANYKSFAGFSLGWMSFRGEVALGIVELIVFRAPRNFPMCVVFFVPMFPFGLGRLNSWKTHTDAEDIIMFL